jgi:hypothetical protein
VDGPVPEREVDPTSPLAGLVEVRLNKSPNMFSDTEPEMPGALLHGAFEALGKQKLESLLRDGHRLDLRLIYAHKSTSYMLISVEILEWSHRRVLPISGE